MILIMEVSEIMLNIYLKNFADGKNDVTIGYWLDGIFIESERRGGWRLVNLLGVHMPFEKCLYLLAKSTFKHGYVEEHLTTYEK